MPRSDLRARASRVARHQVVRNAASLYWVQIATMLVPLATLPYVTRVVGGTAMGTIVFAQSLSGMLVLLLDFGFTQSVTREISLSREDPGRMSGILAGVLGATGVLAVIALLPSAVVVMVVPSMHAHPQDAALAWLAAVAGGFTPNWFFLGIETVRAVAIVQLVARIAGAILTFILVHRASDAWIVLALSAGSGAVGALYLIIRMSAMVPLRWPRRADVHRELERGWRLFISSAAISLYTTVNVFILGLFAPAAQVALYGLADRVVRTLTQLFGPVSAAVYPRLTHLLGTDKPGRARRLARAALTTLMLSSIAGGIVLAVLARPIVRLLFGPEYAGSAAILRVLCLIIPMIGYSTILGTDWMLSLKMDRQMVRIVTLGAVANIVLALVLAPLSGAHGLAWSVVAAELCVAVGITRAVVRHPSAHPDEQFFTTRRRPPD
jgi:PST family polysaccharide transporter